MFRRVGDLLGARSEAERLIAQFEATVAKVTRRRGGRPICRVLLLEWFDPPYSYGHWNPELITLAGGVEVIAQPGSPSRRLTWEEVAAPDPKVILLAPCGFTLERSQAELPALVARPEWSGLAAVQSRQVVLVDGSAYFSRPGPRLEASLRIAAAAVEPETCADLAPDYGWRRL
jgi:iron complex transport system substrate-binding protein